MAIFSDISARFRNARDRSLPRGQRFFAALECIFMPVSFVTVIALFVLPVAKRCFGLALPHWFDACAFPILVSAAIGYLTNWIAIDMLFKPYERTWRHPYPWITFGLWRQGLVPKNKDRIAEVMGKQVAERLLQPEKLADDLCGMVGGALENPAVVESIRDGLRRQIAEHDKEIVDFLAPRIENALVGEIDRLVTADSVEAFWRDEIEPRLQSQATRDEVARMLVAALDRRAPQLAAKARPLVVKAIENWAAEKAGAINGIIPIGGIVSKAAGAIADAIVDKSSLETGLRQWLEDEGTIPVLRDELLQFVKSVRDYLKSPEAQEKVGGFVEEMRGRFKAYVRKYISEHLVPTAESFLKSEDLWKQVAALIPRFKPELERLIREQGMPMIVEKIDVQGRIKTAVDAMDMREFHGMVNEVGAQHLGAIQVLGYILGAIAGALMMVSR